MHARARQSAPIPPDEIAIAIPIPRPSRRGLLSKFCCMDEVTNPYALPRKKKWTITAIVALAGAAAPMGSSIVLPALQQITHDFSSTATTANLSVAMYMLSMSIFPLWWSSFSETWGRRSIYVVSFFLFLVFNVLAAVSGSMGVFVVMRLLSGGAAASVQAVGAGTIADVWAVKERGAAMGMFYLGPLCGPLLSPIIGGAFAQTLGWRSAQWFLAIFGAFLEVLIVFALPETLRQRKDLVVVDEAGVEVEQPELVRTTTKQSVHVKTRKYWLMARRAFIDPLRVVLYLQFPAVAVLVAYASVTFAELYVLNVSVQQNFSGAPYNYGPVIVGCLYLPNSAGYFLSSIFGGRWVDRIMHREARNAGRYDANGRLVFLPEDRMKENAWLGAMLYPFSLLAYGWFAQYKINVAGALVANFFFGIGSMLIFALVTTMLTEFMPRKASSGIALNNFVRNIFSCVGSIVTEPLIVAIGNGPLFSGLCVIALAAGIACMWSLKTFGPRWRIVWTLSKV
ncbi:uncharacterized protein MYCFIDRAFT_187941 [Pseudocercospora fijiensis CIRAD86]|uniref:Major facilitator superfamily (MFS) profile domain-containing protein n=1 Tax=Pseudocercospora fijiensis (strain CIRAD86) TaxID=383855 RepID=M2ZUA8_PSEFD|nr:uncharacterized protein MYCFIDRAFT_187941 [Pseudocercospora fijiensis CIRAD86]EME82589.1 hypothetical protein MYCFIDRAFT_187941 [Pseudocercospora fijiensis CIRAD86]